MNTETSILKFLLSLTLLFFIFVVALEVYSVIKLNKLDAQVKELSIALDSHIIEQKAESIK